MDNFLININPQYVRLTDEKEEIDGNECFLHEVQKRIKLDFEQLPEFTIITAPTGTGKSYAFPFPVLNAKNKPRDIDSEYDSVRGLIVLPTNALISELTASFKETYEKQGLVINEITSQSLNEYGVKGYNRWKKVIEIAQKSDLIITNPDLINYAMHGGYHQLTNMNRTGATRFDAFLQLFNYFIFDEYHLYDEAQIANILTMVKLREFFLPNHKAKKGTINGLRFLFVSATPEEGLKKIFETEGYEYEEIIEEIIANQSNARPIHGKLEVAFFDSKDIKGLVKSKIPELQEVLKTKKALIILDRLRDVQELAEALQPHFKNYIIYQSTGYVSKSENHKEEIKKAHLIIATNKAEVGVNYDVEYCIMQPGKYFQNFVQRFGRVSRGDLTGKIVVSVAEQFRNYQKAFKKTDNYDYYDFLNLMRGRMQGRKFYAERVPMYVGEYVWCIANQIRRNQEYQVSQVLQRRLNETGFFKSKDAQRFYLLQNIHKLICQMMKIALGKDKISQTYWNDEVKKLKHRHRLTYEWAIWWNGYLDTYLTFRDGSKVVKIYDRIKDEELEYSLDWIIQHKTVEKVEVLQTEPYEIVKYTVGNLKKQDKDIQYTVSTLPNVNMMRNNLLSYNDMFELDKVFKLSVGRIYSKVKNGVTDFDDLQADLCKELLKLIATFSRKRLKIEAVENNDMFI
jgi:CRISPR-associated endonuclease/helicase Cas3